MTLAEEYRLSEYEELSLLHNTEDIYIVRNKMNGTICVKKQMSAELKSIYLFLKQQNNLFLPRIYECVEDGETLIVIEEYLTGKNLKEILEERCISEEEAVSITVKLCRALLPLHCANPPVICRDLKAANVMLTGDGAVKIVDFDISRMYQSGQNRDTKMMGTEGYAAPEQFGFRQTDARTDIYAMGVLLNYMVTKRFPVEEICVGELGVIVRRCVEMNPDDRYQTVLELEQELLETRTGKKIPHTVDRVKEKEPLAKDWRSFLPPGFRAGKGWKMILSALLYLTMTVICLDIEISSDQKALPHAMVRFEQALIFLAMLAFVAIVCNYRNIKHHVPFVNSSDRRRRLWGYLLVGFLLLMAAAWISVVVEMILL